MNADERRNRDQTQNENLSEIEGMDQKQTNAKKDEEQRDAMGQDES